MPNIVIINGVTYIDNVPQSKSTNNVVIQGDNNVIISGTNKNSTINIETNKEDKGEIFIENINNSKITIIKK